MKTDRGGAKRIFVGSNESSSFSLPCICNIYNKNWLMAVVMFSTLVLLVTTTISPPKRYNANVSATKSITKKHMHI